MLSRQTGMANQNGLLLTCHIDNSSPGGAASGGTLDPGSHKTCELRTETMENTCILYNLYKRSPEALFLFKLTEKETKTAT